MTTLVQPSSLEAAFLDCHSDGHQWRHTPGAIDPSEAEPGLSAPSWHHGCIGRRSVCQSCGGERIRWMTRSGEVVNRYRMREGYYYDRKVNDEPAPSRLEYRQRMVSTLFAEFEAAINSAPRKRAAKQAAS